MPKANPLDATKELMSALLRQPPKLHEDMKVGKRSERRKPKTDSEDVPQNGDAKPSKEGR